MTRPRILDLFCGAGGAAMGYHRAGFDVVGVDIEYQPHYPFEFYQADALEVLACWGEHDGRCWAEIDIIHAIHASPPCQHYSVTSSLHDSEHPDLYATTRELLKGAGVPYVIENVIGAPYDSGVVLCGSMFGLNVRRHRNFETSFLVMQPEHRHAEFPEPIDVTGTGSRRIGERPDGGGGNSRKPRNLDEAREAMGIDWMNRRELSQAIPPDYTEHVGAQLIQHLASLTGGSH